MLRFTKLGVDARNRVRVRVLEKRRQHLEDKERDKALSKRIADQKSVFLPDNFYQESDHRTALDKLTLCSSTYDKNSTTCLSLGAFDEGFLPPIAFRDALKKTFDLTFTPKELSSLINDFRDANGNADCAIFKSVGHPDIVHRQFAAYSFLDV